MKPESNPFLGPSVDYIKLSRKRIKESNKIFEKRIKKIMKKIKKL